MFPFVLLPNEGYFSNKAWRGGGVMMKRLAKYPLFALFAAMVVGLFAADLLTPSRGFSQMENRYLATRPALTWRSVKEGAFMDRFEEYTNDQFVLRDAWISLKSMAETLCGKVENNGVVIGADGYLFDKNLTTNTRQLTRNRDHVAAFGAGHAEQPVTFTLIPSSYAVLPDKLPCGLQNVDELAVIQNLYAGLREVAVCDVAPVLLAGGGEDMYYRTDHHWTSAGAYAACSAYVEQQGVEPAALGSVALRHTVDGFYGTYYSKVKRVGIQPDTIVWYDIPVRGVQIDGQEVSGLYDLSKFDERDKYAAFLHSNNGLTVIRAAEEPKGEPTRILLVKDSYGNSYAPFLALYYDEVYVVDLRYASGLSDLLEQVSFDEIHILYGFSSFASDTNVFKLNK